LGEFVVGCMGKLMILVKYTHFKIESMNTVEKGTKFEERVYTKLKEMLENNQLSWANPNFSDIYMQKGYYSRDRDADIKVDVSIEVYPPVEGSSEIALLVPVECKDYQKPVPVGKIEEFNTKVRQISGLNCKAIFFSSSGFQKSARDFAMNNRIALAYLPPNEKINWIHYHGTLDMIENMLRELENNRSIQQLLWQDSPILPSMDAISYYDGKYYFGLARLLNVL
jgi:hypothetical protein